MNQSEILVGIALSLALVVGVVYASGGFDAGTLNDTTENDSVIVKDTLALPTNTNGTDMPEDEPEGENTEPETGIVYMITTTASNIVQVVVEASSSGSSSSLSSSSSSPSPSPSCKNNGGRGSPGGSTTTPTPTTCPPTVTPSPSPGSTTSPAPTVTTTVTPTPTSTPAPTVEPTATTEITIEHWQGTAGVNRTYYYITGHDTETVSIVVESEFPPELGDISYIELHDHIYHFSNVELKNIYLHFYILGRGPNGEYSGGPSLESRFGYHEWTGAWDYTPAETVILIYSENVPVYVISRIDFAQYSFGQDPYTREQEYVPRNYYQKKEVMPEKQPGRPRYYDLPVSAPIQLRREGVEDNPYLPAKPMPTPPEGISDDAFIVITDREFIPRTITVPVGTTVGWTNNGYAVQTITDTGSPSILNRGSLNPGVSFTYKFNNAGEYCFSSYTAGSCTVIVTDDGPPTPGDPAPTELPTALPTSSATEQVPHTPDTPVPTPPQVTPEETPTEEPTPEPTLSEGPVPEIPIEELTLEIPVEELTPREATTSIPEATEELIEEMIPAEGESATRSCIGDCGSIRRLIRLGCTYRGMRLW